MVFTALPEPSFSVFRTDTKSRSTMILSSNSPKRRLNSLLSRLPLGDFWSMLHQLVTILPASISFSLLMSLYHLVRYVPAWFPGAGFQKKASTWASTLFEMVEQPHNFVKQQMSSGTASASFSSMLLEDKQVNPDEEFDVKWAAASLYSGK